MTINPETTVAALAGRYPATVKVFQHYQVEFCCAGQRTIAQTSEDAGIPYADLAAELRQAARATPTRLTWMDRPLSELTDHIVEAFHDPVRQELPRLRQAATKLLGHAERRRGVWTIVNYELGRFEMELTKQMSTEEAELFPLLERLTREPLEAQERAHLAVLRRQIDAFHQDTAYTSRLLRRITGGYEPPVNACGNVRALYRGLAELEALTRLHVHMEINVLFPRAAALALTVGVESQK